MKKVCFTKNPVPLAFAKIRQNHSVHVNKVIKSNMF